MKLKNKKTGEIKDVRISRYEDSAPILITETTPDNNGQTQGWPYNSLAELNEEWEDYEEPKSGIEGIRLNDMISGRHIVEIDFTKVEEAEKAVEKLKAWKRLKEKGFRFVEHQIHGITPDGEGDGCAYFEFDKPLGRLDLDLLFGGEDE